ncbi:Gfo/Idh/MocA family oxidoreductase [Tannockella kyphosi]|uniref:Gfo/Idh/MocA family oxidoreductase n=1 Tax=Tannockella kyphosi TaxID=2899121 RepID=UPI0020128DDF|nr:Gfo/Idh/MocA family oxidoreductase [Tannockella kyphosi]
MMTIGFIGNGKSTNRYHLPFIVGRDSIHIKSIYQRDLTKRDWNRIEGVHYTDNIDELLNDDEIQVLVISTSSQTHYEYTKLALEHGKNVLCEKPFVETYKEAKELFDLADEKGLHLQTYQNRRYDSDYLTVQKVLESGKLGDVFEVEMNYDYFRPEVSKGIHEYKRFDNFIYAHGSHTVDQAIALFGQPEQVVSDMKQVLGPNRYGDYFDLDFIYESFKVSIRSSYFRIKGRPSFVVYGTNGMFVKQTIDRQEEHLKLFYMPGSPDFGKDTLSHYGVLTYVDECGEIKEETVTTCSSDYGRTYDDLYEVIINKKEPTITKEQILAQIKILENAASKCQ